MSWMPHQKHIGHDKNLCLVNTFHKFFWWLWFQITDQLFYWQILIPHLSRKTLWDVILNHLLKWHSNYAATSRDGNQLKCNFDHKNYPLTSGWRQETSEDWHFLYTNLSKCTQCQDVLLRTHHCCYSSSSTVVAKKHHAAAQTYQQHSSTTALHVFRVICVRGNRPGRIIGKHDHSGTNHTSSTGA